MPTLLIFHEVDDVEHWLSSPKREEVFGPLGITVRTFIDPAKTQLVAFDTIQPALDLMREGKVAVLVGQKYFGWGSEPVKLLYDIKHGKMPPATIIDSGLDVVTRDNVEDYAAKWKKMESGG